MLLDNRATLETDIGRGGRVNGKEAMARRRYQEGCLFTRGKGSRKVWVARWREDALRLDGTVGRIMRSQVLGPVGLIPTKREARQLLNSLLRPTNQGLRKTHSTMLFGDFARKWEEAVLPTYRASTRNFYRYTLRRHLAPSSLPIDSAIFARQISRYFSTKKQNVTHLPCCTTYALR